MSAILFGSSQNPPIMVAIQPGYTTHIANLVATRFLGRSATASEQLRFCPSLYEAGHGACAQWDDVMLHYLSSDEYVASAQH